MANDYFDNSDETKRFQPGVTARGSEVDDKLDGVQQGFAKLPPLSAEGKGFSGPVNVGPGTDPGHAANLSTVVAKMAEWGSAQFYVPSQTYSFPAVVIGSDLVTYRFVGETPVTGDDPVTSETGNWASYASGGTKTLGTLTATMTDGQTTNIPLEEESDIPIVTVTKEIVDTNVINSDWDVAPDGSNFTVENQAYATSITPSATTGDITLSLGAGSFATTDVGKRIRFNGGAAYLTAADGSASVVQDFNDTAPTTEWEMVGVEASSSLTIAGQNFGWQASSESTSINPLGTNVSYVYAFHLSNTNVFKVYNFLSSTSTALLNEDGELVSGPNEVIGSGTRKQSSACRLPSGDILIAYSDGAGAILAATYNQSGSAISGPTTISGIVTPAHSPQVVAYSGGNILLLYQTGSGYSRSVLNSSLSPLNTVSTDFSFSFQFAQNSLTLDDNKVAVNISGDICIIDSYGDILATANTAFTNYVDMLRINNGSQILAAGRNGFAIIDNAGAILTPRVSYTSDSVDYSSSTSMALLDDGNIAIVYTTNSDDIGYAIVGPDGSIVSNGAVFATGTFEFSSVTPSSTGFTVTAVNLSNNTLSAFTFAKSGYAADSEYLPALTTASTDTSIWTTINSTTLTASENGETLYYALSVDGRQSFCIVDSGASPRMIARNNAGTWEYNADNNYASETWSAASRNSVYGALSDAMGVAVNQMDAAQWAAAASDDYPALTETLDLAVILYTSSQFSRPVFEQATLNYDANARYAMAVPGTDYEWDQPSPTTIRFTSLASSNLKVRIV